jgi:plasmid stabilization system protein ParE
MPRVTLVSATTRDQPGGIDMPQKAWSDKRERQYEHIKDSYQERGVSTDEAEERAARTVNKERSEHGETKAQKKARSR